MSYLTEAPIVLEPHRGPKGSQATPERPPAGRGRGAWLAWLLAGAGWGQVAAAEVTLAWDPNPEPTVAGYRLHWGESAGAYTSRLDVGNVTTATITSLAAGTTYYFAATAYDGSGLESLYSNEVQYTPPFAAPPNHPPLAEDQTVTVPEDGRVTVMLGATDPEDDPLTFVVVTPPAFGVLSGTGDRLAYAPHPDFHGTDAFTFRASDGNLDSNLGTVQVMVVSVNDPPTLSAVPDQEVVLGGTAGPWSLAVGDVDHPADTLVVSATSSHPAVVSEADIRLGGSGISRTVALTASGQPGSSTITLTVSDGLASAATSFLVTVLATLPPPWSNADVGTPGVEGSAFGTLAAINVRGGGTGIGGSTDQFHLVSQTMAGDGEVTARLTPSRSDLPLAQAGVMMRERLTSTSPYYALVVTPNGARLLWRTSEGGKSTEVNGGTLSASDPVWLRIRRSGNQFRAFRSDDGVRWTQVGSFLNHKMLANLHLGMVVSSRDTAQGHEATFDSITAVP